MSRFVIIDSMFEDNVFRSLDECILKVKSVSKCVLNLSGDIGDIQTSLSSITNNMKFDSIGIISHGHTIEYAASVWMSDEISTTLSKILVDDGSIDFFACNMHDNDVMLKVMSSRLCNTPIYFSTNKTGSDLKSGADWLMERVMKNGSAKNVDTERNVADLYLGAKVDYEKYTFAFATAKLQKRNKETDKKQRNEHFSISIAHSQ
jgi:hypothetical protein